MTEEKPNPRRSIRGRGTAHDPPNRFLPLVVEREAWTREEDPAPATRLLEDRTQSVVARNSSPDVGFDASLNPYRGCEHGCVYCLAADTPVLLADGSARPIRDLAPGDEIYGTRRDGRERRYARTRVLAHWETRKPAYRIDLGGGAPLVASADHRFLTRRGWRFVADAVPRGDPRPRLETGDELLGPGGGGATRDLEGAVLAPSPSRVRSIERLGRTLRMYDITTGTGDFIAHGVVSHNCYARPTHEYLGFSAGLDFETKIVVKRDAPRLLREELASPGWTPRVLALSGVTDPYQPVERHLEVTRGCLEVLAEARNPVAVITKNHLVTRDIDLLRELARHGAVSVSLSVTTLDRELQRAMEPRTAVPDRRLDAIARLAGAGIPVGVNVAPVIPGLTDHEIPAILEAAAGAGARRATYIMLRLPLAVAPLFEDWLERCFPHRKKKVLNRMRELRGGRLYDSTFGTRMRGTGPFADQVRRLFEVARAKHGLDAPAPPLSTGAFRAPRAGPQLRLFD